MTKQQLESFVEGLGSGWYLRQDTTAPGHQWGIYRSIKNQGYPRQIPDGWAEDEFNEFWREQIITLQNELIEADTNRLSITGRSDGWIGWDFSNLLCEDENSPWVNDEFGTIVESVREELIEMADKIDATIQLVNTQSYWDELAKKGE